MITCATKTFNKLSYNHKCLVINTMTHMEHTLSKKEIDIKYGITLGRLEKDYTESEMLELATKLYKEKENIHDDTFNIYETYRSMMKRNSRNSKLYPILLEILDIDDNIIDTCYFSSLGSFEELFNTLSSQNQTAIIYLMKNLETNYTISLSPNEYIGITLDSLPIIE